MLPWSFSEEAAAKKHMVQLQHNMWVTNARNAAMSIITGGGKRIEMSGIPADALYQHFLVTVERRFWRCVQTGETPRPYDVEPPAYDDARTLVRKRDLTTTGAMQRWSSIRLHSISRGAVRRSWRSGDRLCG
jgi:hypothetical protein